MQGTNLGRIRLVAVALAAIGVAGCASRNNDEAARDQDRARSEQRMDNARRGISDAATSPLRDVGLIRPEIPAVLQRLRYPYITEPLAGGCPAVLYEIGQLDAVLGSESYQPGVRRGMVDRGMDSASGAAVGVVRDAAGEVVPFRGWVRRASGADRAARDAAAAIELGQMRRAFLRGYGASLGCANVLPPPPPAPTAETPERERR